MMLANIVHGLTCPAATSLSAIVLQSQLFNAALLPAIAHKPALDAQHRIQWLPLDPHLSTSRHMPDLLSAAPSWQLAAC